MKAEQYIFKYMQEHEISIDTVENETGISLKGIWEKNTPLKADDFLRLCVYLDITPEEISDQILYNDNY